MTDLAKLNRLRVNAGKPELKAWKASKDKLAEAITALEQAGFTDALPGANVTAEAKIDDPELAKARPEPEKPEEPPAGEKKPEPEVKKQKPQLAKGLETESMARQSRIAVQMQRDREKAEARAAKDAEKAEKKANKKDKKKKDKAPKEEKLPKGAVDPKKDPEKAARQKKHIEDKKKAREAKGNKKPAKEVNANEITVADIARELNIDPKVARAKLRRHEDKIEKLHTKGQDRWTFPKTAKAELVKILK